MVEVSDMMDNISS